MRLFVAFDLPEVLGDYCFVMQKKLLFGNAVFTRAKHFHCTLKFLGEINDESVPKIVEQLETVKFEPFKSVLSRPGVFPDDKQPKVLWLGLDKADNVIELQQKIEQSLKEFNIQNDHKNFTPHITLARIQKVKDKNHFRENLTRFEKHEFQIDKFILYKSELKNTGPEYTKIEEFQGQSL